MIDQERARACLEPFADFLDPHGLMVMAVVSALSAVREEQKERDAKIADQWADAASEGDGEVWIASKIASAIRSSTEGDRHAG